MSKKKDKHADTEVDQLPDETTLESSLLDWEYKYLVDSSFHSDSLRNQIIQIYLGIVGVAGTVILGLQNAGWIGNDINTAFAILALFISLIGFIMVPIFARLRRIVIECMQGTALIKRYIFERGEKKNIIYPNAFLWDADSLPSGTNMLTASFLLIFIVIFLDSAMLAIAVYLFPFAKLPTSSIYFALAVLSGFLTIQVLLYRYMLWKEIEEAMKSDRLQKKWENLIDKNDPLFPKPNFSLQLIVIFLVGAVITFCLAIKI